MSWRERLQRALHGPALPRGVELAGARLFESVRIGGAIERDGIEALARAGFRALLAVGAEGEPGELLSPSVEASWAHTFGLAHARLYVDGLPPGSAVDELRARLRELPRPLYVHSREGERAIALAAVLLALERGLDGERALEEAAAAGRAIASPDLRRFVIEELRVRASAAPA
jgi:protein tyrosine phosphatase (PTP) superfamily phosphohydrolase (DUF442 family)